MPARMLITRADYRVSLCAAGIVHFKNMAVNYIRYARLSVTLLCRTLT